MPKVNTIHMQSWEWNGIIDNKPIRTSYVEVDRELYALYRVAGKLKNKTLYITPLKAFTTMVPKEEWITKVEVRDKKPLV